MTKPAFRSFLLSAGLAALLCGCASSPSGAPAGAGSRGPATPGSSAGDVALLSSGDFVERSRAAERLVVAGEAALEDLGAAGEMPVAAPGSFSVSATRPVIEAILARVPADRLVSQLDAPFPVVRRVAAEETGRRGGWSPIPTLIARLEDQDATVRTAAALSLRRLTNQFFGPASPVTTHERAAVTARWREWWQVEGRVRAAEGRTPGPG